MKFFKNLKRLKKLFGDEYWWAKSNYIKYFDNLPIDDKAILLESEHGKKLNGNIFYLVRYLSNSEKYKDFKIYVSSVASKVEKCNEFLAAHKISGVKVVVMASDEYMRLLASAKYIVNDTSFSNYYMKKEGQIYINTWHGTPLKALGRSDVSGFWGIANIQKNFLAADILLYPNEYTRDIMLKDYMLENISRGRTMLSGYPRNEIFFDKAAAERIREECGLTGKRVYAYMPTYRGSVGRGRTDTNSANLIYYLTKLDASLEEDELFFVNLHPLAKENLDFSIFKNIRQMPEEYETYEFLNASDVLITDYSSVFFDFAISGKKIILFTYDEEEYIETRGMYMDMSELPFTRVYSEGELLSEMRCGKSYDDGDFLKRFCAYDSADASARLCDSIILGEDTGVTAEEIKSNGKKNVLIYAGNLAANGITTSIRTLMSSLTLSENNYYLSFISEKVSANREALLQFPAEVNYLATTGDMNVTFGDRITRKLFKSGLMSTKSYMKRMKKRVAQDFARRYVNAKFDTVIQFNGYENEVMLCYSTFDGNKTIFVHNDMIKEAKTRKNQRLDLLKYVYGIFDSVAIVTEDMRAPTLKISGKEDNIKVVRNTIEYKSVLEKSELPVAYDEYTEATVSEDRLTEILNSQGKKFINIGRFSPEKGQDRLVEAFAKYNKENPDSYLIIIGGNETQGYYGMLGELKDKLGLTEKVILIKRMSNPYSILKKCDYFVLSSHYEGFGLVLAEADILGIPVVSTDIDGPRLFMKKQGGVLVENSDEGIYRGLCMLGAGKVKPMGVDYAAYNREAVEEFKSIL